VENSIINIGKKLDNLNNVIKNNHPQDAWILEKVLPLFMILINSATTPEQEQRIIMIMNPLFDTYEYRFGLTLENLGQQIVSQLLEGSTPIVALYPGKFKPPHAGHFNVVEKAANIADKVIVIMSNIPKDEFTPEDSMKVWGLYEDILPDNVQIIISDKSSPVSEVFNIIKDKTQDFIVLYGKGEESRYRAIEKDPNTYSNVKIVDAGTFESLNATDLRNAIRNKDLEDIQKFLPASIDAKKVLNIYTQKEFKPGPILHESFTPQKAPLMKKFVEYACNELEVNEPKINVINSPTYSQEYKSFGGYIPSEEKIMVVVHNRNMADILRTLAHELVHHMQNINGNELNGEDGSETENEANAMAGVIMRKFGRENPEIFE
jgi:cytidyltransferase-like protein